MTAPRPAAAMAAPPDVVRAVMAEDTEGGAQPQHEPQGVSCELNGQQFVLRHGAVVIAAITSCTNTSNPSVMLAAGMLARNAVRAGLATKPWVKTSLAPGSKVVTDYFRAAGVLGDLSALGFNVVGYGCTTCIGNSGPLPPAIADAIEQGNWSRPRCSPATATSKGASTRSPGSTIWRRRRWSWRMRWPGGWTSTSRPSRWASGRRAPSSCATSGRPRGMSKKK